MPYRNAYVEPDRLYEAEVPVDHDVPQDVAHLAAFGLTLGYFSDYAPAPTEPVLTGRKHAVMAVLRPPLVVAHGYRPAQLHELMAFHAAYPGLVDDTFFLVGFGSVLPAHMPHLFHPILRTLDRLRYVTSTLFTRGEFMNFSAYFPRAVWAALVVLDDRTPTS